VRLVAVLSLALLPVVTAADRPPAERMVVDDCFAQPPPAAAATVRGFVAYGGRWRATDGVLWGQGDGGSKLLLDQPLPADSEVVAEVFLAPHIQWSGLITCVSDPGVGADRFYGYEVSVNPGRRELRLGAHRNNFELIRDVPCELPSGQWVELSVRRQGSRLDVRLNGRLIVSHDDGRRALAAGRAGCRVWHGDLQVRNLRVVLGETTKRISLATADGDADDPRFATSGTWTPMAVGGHAGFRYADGGLFAANKSQMLALRAAPGETGISTGGRTPDGSPFVAGQSYAGAVWARADQPAKLWITAEAGDGRPLAEVPLAIAAGEWRCLPFRLVPAGGEARGRLAVRLRDPGEVRLGRVRLAPGDWAWPESLTTRSLPPILFLARHMLSGPPVVGCDLWAARPTKPGCAIGIWDPARPDDPPRMVFADPAGCIYDINLSLDAQTVYFSYVPDGQKHWHLWRIGVDGSGLRQITDGPFYDVGPCELPDGDLVFVSTRRFGHTVCQPGPASNLYRVSPEGGRPQCLSMNTLSDTTPQLLPDGRVLFMRWEYVDRDLTYRQSLWTQNPDGTGYQLYFGNTIRDPGTFWQARPIPGRSDRVLATFAPHHGYPHGAIGWAERGHGPETPRGVGFDWITQEFPTIGDHAYVWSYRDPFPLDEERFLCSYAGAVQKFRLFLHDLQDRRRLLYEHPEMHCFFPIALRPTPRPPLLTRRAPVREPSAPDLPEEHPADAQPTGICVLADVYQGLEPTIARGRVRSIRIMEQVRKTEDIPVTPHIVEFGPRSYDQSPLMSYGTYYAKRCWGTVPVEDDGSAHFEIPALREVYFQACDAEGRELQRMTSGVQVMPGETLSCIGCHENRTWAPPARGSLPLAARRAPSVPQKPAWAPDGIIDFVTVVQPVLDKHCARCHSGGNPDGGYDLSGDKTRLFNMAYDNLLGRSRSYRQHKMDTGEMLPEEAAQGKPLVHFYWLLKTPTAVNQPLWAGSHASRLAELLESQHGDVRMPREDRERIYTWIDANVPYYGTFATSRPKCGGKRDLCQDPETAEPEAWFAHGFMPVYARRCATCHGEFPQTRLITCWDGRTAWINFTRPQYSAALTAHLPKSAGGRGIDKMRDGKPIPLFAGVDDPDYQTMLAAVREGKRHADAHPGPDMPGFRFARKEP
jgi:hypothetical protein